MKKLTLIAAFIALCCNYALADGGPGPQTVSIIKDNVATSYKINDENWWENALCNGSNADYSNLNKKDAGNPGGLDDLQGTDFGTPQSLSLDGAAMISWGSDYGDNSYTLKYRVYLVGSTAPALTEAFKVDQLIATSGNDKRYEVNGKNVNLLAEAGAPGTYTLEVVLNVNGTDAGAKTATFTVTTTDVFAKFAASAIKGLKPLAVTFTNQSANATAYSWDFGDDSPASTEENPEHTFTTAGQYTVTLTASDADGNTSTYSLLITVIGFTPAEGEMLTGGTPLIQSAWQVATLNPAELNPTLAWDDETGKPDGSIGNALRITQAQTTNTSCSAIYQTVNLKAGHTYQFDCLFKDLHAEMMNFWMQVYITKEQPLNTQDLAVAAGETPSHIGELSTWAPEHYPDKDPVGLNGLFSSKAVKGGGYSGELCKFIPEEDGEYYFIIRFGVWNYSMDAAFSDLSLMDLGIVSGVEDKEADSKVAVYTQSNQIVVESAEAIRRIVVYNANGSVVEAASNTKRFASQALTTGFYLVKADGKVLKVAVK